jgi:hypothetical protein
MFQRLGIILDIPAQNYSLTLSIEKHQTILETCSILIALFNSENPTSQTSLLLTTGQSIGQLTHLSGDIRHHNQGIWYLIFGNKKLSNFDLGFFFYERINMINKKIKYELFFISDGSLDFLDSNFFAVFMGKEKRCFSVISFGLKSFSLQIMTKVTGGKYITLFEKQKIILSSLLVNNFKKRYSSDKANFLNFSFSFNRLVLGVLNLKPGPKIIRSKTVIFCPSCKNIIFFKSKNWCENCEDFILSGQHLVKSIGSSFIKRNLNKNSIVGFNLFIPILKGKKVHLKLYNDNNFNFPKSNKSRKSEKIYKELDTKDLFNGHYEVLMTKI